MSEEALQAHWNRKYSIQDPDQLTWYQEVPERTLDMLERTDCGPKDAIIDIGGGASTLVDVLLARGYEDVSVLDLSHSGMRCAKDRLGIRAGDVSWLEEDVTSFIPERRYKVWHDRAVFHFLTDPVDRALYAAVAAEAIEPGGWLILATFAPDGPDRCSGLPTCRYDVATASEELGPDFLPVHEERERHNTPGGSEQRFCWCLFQRSNV